MKRILLIILAVICSTILSFGQELQFTYRGTIMYKMSPDEIENDLAGNFHIHIPSEEEISSKSYMGGPDLIANKSGFILTRILTEILYPPTGSGNITGTIPYEAKYYGGSWYKGYREDGSILYILKGFKRSIEVMKFLNTAWIGNYAIECDRSDGGIILQHDIDDIWYYKCKKGYITLIRAENESQITYDEEAKTLEESGLDVEEWAIGLWKAELSQMDRQRDLADYDEKLSQEEIYEVLKDYNSPKTFYLEIAKDYLRYQFPLPIHHGGEKQETCNDFSIQHNYTIEEGKWGGYDILVGETRLATISRNDSELHLTTGDDYSIFSIQLYRVNDLGIIKEETETELPENFVSQSQHLEDTDSEAYIFNKRRYWKNISWVYGEWQIPNDHPSGKDYAVRITPFSINFAGDTQKPLKAMQGDHFVHGSVVYIDELYLDIAEKRLYKLENDKKLYLEQTSEEKYILLTITFWFLLSTIGIGFLWGLFVILKALIRL